MKCERFRTAFPDLVWKGERRFLTISSKLKPAFLNPFLARHNCMHSLYRGRCHFIREPLNISDGFNAVLELCGGILNIHHYLLYSWPALPLCKNERKSAPNEELFFLNTLNTNPKIEVAMTMPSLEIMLWKRDLHKYVQINAYVKSSFLKDNNRTQHRHCNPTFWNGA